MRARPQDGHQVAVLLCGCAEPRGSAQTQGSGQFRTGRWWLGYSAEERGFASLGKSCIRASFPRRRRCMVTACVPQLHFRGLGRFCWWGLWSSARLPPSGPFPPAPSVHAGFVVTVTALSPGCDSLFHSQQLAQPLVSESPGSPKVIPS